MGQRANLILVEGNKYELYYDHWCANRLDAYLFWGVDRAAQFFREHAKQGDEWWIDNIWCEGGAVIDLNKKILLWFGGEDISYDIPLRRLMLELMRMNWQDYRILWAHEGVADMADYVGYDRNKVIAPFNEKELFNTEKIQNIFNPTDSNDYWDCVISFSYRSGDIEIYTGYISSYLKEFLYFGSDMIQLKEEGKFYTEYTDNPEGENALHSGIHIDLQGRELHVWSCYQEIFDFKRLQTVWRDYKIYYHKDKFEVHTKLTNNKLIFEQCDKVHLINKVKKIVCIDSKNPLETINSLVDRISEQGKEVQLIPAAYMAKEVKSDRISQEKEFDKLIYKTQNTDFKL